MRRTRRTAKANSAPNKNDSGGSDDEPLKKKKVAVRSDEDKEIRREQGEDGSSESDLETYLKPADQIDLDSSFFTPLVKQNVGFDAIENDILSGIRRVSDSDSELEEEEEEEFKSARGENVVAIGENYFKNLNTHNDKLEYVRKQVEEYNAKKKVMEENKLDVRSMLGIMGEAGSSQADVNNLHSSDFESMSESEREDWEEVKMKEEKAVVPKDGVEIRVEMPDTIRKKKGFDLMAAIKRRVNRVKKEMQLYVHKVHLLCWIAHGNYVNKVLNSSILLGFALSLLPSQHCYPPSRLDLTYLQQILSWYRKAMSIHSNNEKSQAKESLEDSLRAQISKKEAHDYKAFVYVFICILRSLGLSARLVLSLQVESLRPPITELCSLSNKNEPDKKSATLKISKAKKNLNTSKKDVSKMQQVEDVNRKKVKVPRIKIAETDQPRKNDKNISKSNPKSIADFSYKEKKTYTKDEVKAEANTKNEVEKMKGRKPSINLKDEGKKFKKSRTTTLKASQVNEKSTTVKNELTLSNLKLEEDLKPLRRSSRLSAKSPTELDQKEKEICDEVFVESDSDSTRAQKKSRKPNLFKVKINFKKIQNSGTTQTGKHIETDGGKLDEKTFAGKRVKQRDEGVIQIPQVDGTNDTSESDSPSTKTRSRKHKPNISKLKNKTESTMKQTKSLLPSPSKKKVKVSPEPEEEKRKQTKSLLPSPSKKQVKVSPEPEEEKRSGNTKKLSLKKLRTPLDIKLANLRDQARSQSSSDSDRSRFFGSSPKKQVDVRNDIISLVKQGIVQQKETARAKLVKHKRTSKKHSDVEDDNDSDYLPGPIKNEHDENDDFKEKAIKVKRRVPMRKDLAEVERIKRGQKEEEKRKKCINVWVEVFAEAEDKWISVDVVKGKLHCVSELYSRATSPVSYILAWDNDNYMKDVTKRYCAQWNTVTRKLRVDPRWWDASLKPFLGPRTVRSREEDDELAREQLEKPLPTTISEYKDHPLYVLKRHLLKFQAIYPPDAPTLGFIRSEPVYSRDCVYVLHSRELWLKEAKVVKPGEQPYKIVKARPKYDKLSNSVITDRPLEIFGMWQIEDYVPPSAENGVVPRNAYGNVELFKPCMLPKGTVHLQLPGLNKVARKLNVDCAPAVTGFDFHGGWNHAIFDGYIVCEEHADKLVAAWYMEQEEAEKRAQEKIEKRVYDNWRKLIRGLLIRERLKARYDFGAPTDQNKNKAKGKSAKLCTKKRRIKSDSESD